MDQGSQNSNISADEFQALEQKVLRAVEIVRREREARAAAEAEAAAAKAEAEAAATGSSLTRRRPPTPPRARSLLMNQERDVRSALRVEKMLQQMDELL